MQATHTHTTGMPVGGYTQAGTGPVQERMPDVTVCRAYLSRSGRSVVALVMRDNRPQAPDFRRPDFRAVELIDGEVFGRTGRWTSNVHDAARTLDRWLECMYLGEGANR